MNSVENRLTRVPRSSLRLARAGQCLLHEACLRPEGTSRTINPMEVHFTAEQEERLVQAARAEGTNAEHLVREAALRLLSKAKPSSNAAPELPKVHLGPVTSLHRRDLYDDVG